MSTNKTKINDGSVEDFIWGAEAKYQGDCLRLCKMMEEATGASANMWGDSLVGFGQYNYKYASGKEGTWFLTGFSPRKQNLTIYIMPGFEPFGQALSELGKHKTGKSCLYIKSLSDIDENVLEKMLHESVKIMRQKYQC